MDLSGKIVKVLNKFRPKEETPSCSVVIVAAGSSTRMGSDKIFMEIGGMPVIARTVKAFEDSPLVREIIIVTRQESIQPIADLCVKYSYQKVSKVVCGGKTRAESALAGVSEVSHSSKLIAIHDGARPLVTNDIIVRTVYAARDYLSAVPVVPSTDTLKVLDDEHYIVGEADRSVIYRVQTPQVFDADLIRGALTAAMKKNLAITDDCSAMDLMGVKTCTVTGDEDNIKLTTPNDVLRATEILRRRGEIV